jgi:hypothetical protein
MFSFLEKDPDKQNNHILYIKVENDLLTFNDENNQGVEQVYKFSLT